MAAARQLTTAHDNVTFPDIDNIHTIQMENKSGAALLTGDPVQAEVTTVGCVLLDDDLDDLPPFGLCMHGAADDGQVTIMQKGLAQSNVGFVYMLGTALADADAGKLVTAGKTTGTAGVLEVYPQSSVLALNADTTIKVIGYVRDAYHIFVDAHNEYVTKGA